MKMAQFVFLIDGPIGVGKSELLKYLHLNRRRFDEFLKKDEGEELEAVQEFYDPEALSVYYRFRDKIHNYNELFEKSQLVGRQVRLLKAKHGKGMYAFDRGMISGVRVFTETSFDECNLTLQTRERIYDEVKLGIDVLGRKEAGSWLEQVVFYLYVDDPAILYDRQRHRNSKGEEEIPLAYLARIHHKYQEHYSNCREAYAMFGLPAPKVVQIDASADFRQDIEYHPRTLQAMLSTLREMKPDAAGR